jgi:hypothetical protein
VLQLLLKRGAGHRGKVITGVVWCECVSLRGSSGQAEFWRFERLTSHPSQSARRMGHPSFLGWLSARRVGTRAFEVG